MSMCVVTLLNHKLFWFANWTVSFVIQLPRWCGGRICKLHCLSVQRSCVFFCSCSSEDSAEGSGHIASKQPHWQALRQVLPGLMPECCRAGGLLSLCSTFARRWNWNWGKPLCPSLRSQPRLNKYVMEPVHSYWSYFLSLNSLQPGLCSVHQRSCCGRCQRRVGLVLIDHIWQQLWFGLVVPAIEPRASQMWSVSLILELHCQDSTLSCIGQSW